MPRSVDQGADVAGSVHSFTTEQTSATDELTSGSHKKYKWHKRFAYQKFVGWRPILTPRIAELFFLTAGVLLLALGIPILIASLNVVTVTVPYAFEGPFANLSSLERQQLLWAKGDAGVEHNVTVTVDKAMKPPIWVVTELGSYFQNYRRYVRSFDPSPMHKGVQAGKEPASACGPFAYLGGNESLPINPCGQIASSYFNDTYSLLVAPPGGAGPGPGPVPVPVPVALDDSSIAWSSDAKHLYGSVAAQNYNTVPDLRGGNTTTAPLNQAQHWMVWMRPGSQVMVQKLYARVDVEVEAGAQLTLVIRNRYNTYDFSGTKSVLLTTNSWVGGRNIFMGAVYLATGGVSLLVSLAFFLAYNLGFVWKRQYGDLANLSWVRQPNSGHQHGGHEPVHREPGADADAVAVATAGAAAAQDGQDGTAAQQQPSDTTAALPLN